MDTGRVTVRVSTRVLHSWVARDGAAWACAEIAVEWHRPILWLMREGDQLGEEPTYRVGS